jgi:hypothetical protein
VADALSYSGDRLGIPAPLTFTKSARASWQLYRGHFRTIVPFYIAVFTVVGLVRTLGFSLFDAVGLSASATVAVVSLALTVVVAVAGSAAVAVVSVVFADGVTARRTGAGSATGRLRPRWRDVVSAGLVTSMLSVLAIFLPFGTLGSIVIMPMLFGPPILVHTISLEGLGFSEAWSRARSLYSGQMGRLVIYMLNVALGLGLLQIILLTFAFSATLGLTGQLGIVVRALMQALIAGLSLPFLGAMAFVCYLDLRARRENFGLDELRAERATASP